MYQSHLVVEVNFEIVILGFRDHQLVTWSKDQSLRIWKIDAQLQKVRLLIVICTVRNQKFYDQVCLMWID